MNPAGVAVPLHAAEPHPSSGSPPRIAMRVSARARGPRRGGLRMAEPSAVKGGNREGVEMALWFGGVGELRRLRALDWGGWIILFAGLAGFGSFEAAARSLSGRDQ